MTKLGGHLSTAGGEWPATGTKAQSAARGWDGDKTLPHLDDCTLPPDHDGPCDGDVTAGTSAAQTCDSSVVRFGGWHNGDNHKPGRGWYFICSCGHVGLGQLLPASAHRQWKKHVRKGPVFRAAA